MTDEEFARRRAAIRNETHLGDGAYVFRNPYGDIVLYTSNGITQTNTIVLEAAVLRAFDEWREEMKRRESAVQDDADRSLNELSR